MLLHQHGSAGAPDNERFCGVGLWQTPGDQRGILVCGLSSGAGTFTLHAVVLTCPRQMDRPLLTRVSTLSTKLVGLEAGWGLVVLRCLAAGRAGRDRGDTGAPGEVLNL